MKNRNGFSLIELLISLIVAAIIVLTAGTLSDIGLITFNKQSSKQAVYNDLSYGLKLIRNRFRNADSSSVKKNTAASSSWLNNTRLEINNEAFGIYKPNNSTQRDFVYLKDKSDESKREVILSVPEGDLDWTISCDTVCPSPDAVTIVLKGTKNKNPFHMETTIARRNP